MPGRAKGAVASLVLGILAMVPTITSFVFGPLAIMFGVRAHRRVRESGGSLRGKGMGTTGIVLACIGMVVAATVVLAAVVFVLVTQLSETSADPSGTLVVEPGYEALQGFEVGPKAASVSYTVRASGGRDVSTTIVPVSSLEALDQHGTTTYAPTRGSNAQGSVVLAPGFYALRVACASAIPCTVDYTLSIDALTGPLAPPPPGQRPDCAPTRIPSHGAPDALPRWQPPEGATPAGTYFYFEKQYYEGGKHLRKPAVYTPEDDTFQVQGNTGGIQVHLRGVWWDFEFAVPDRCPRAVPGYYDNLTRSPFHNPKVGGIDFSGNGAGCNEEEGAVVVDEVEYDIDGTLTRFTLRFETTCLGNTIGKIHWDIDDNPVRN